jgi:hypothetical protein
VVGKRGTAPTAAEHAVDRLGAQLDELLTWLDPTELTALDDET